MDKKITKSPELKGEIKNLVEEAEKVYWNNFNGETWFGRCIFLSWYCERGTCTFCFRSVTKHQIQHPKKARRSLASVLAEAMMIRGFGWRIEFLTGGYGICNDEELVKYTKLVSQIIQQPMWVNLGEIGTHLLNELKPYVTGIVSSIETLNPELHEKVCPDKPIAPYVKMIKESSKKGFKQGMTIIIGLGEKKEDFPLLEKFISENKIERITIYALRPVKGTPFENGPDPLDVVWWTAKTRIAFPKIEIIVGSAKYRLPELNVVLRAGANAITKLPATNMFNTKKGKEVENQVKLAKRKFISKFSCKNVKKEINWEEMLEGVELTQEEKEEVMKTLNNYLNNMNKKSIEE
jgi:biotin synthase-like enzyme